ncbi:MAG TPA: S8 family serine peptidase, partial [Gemmatimonadaceae bacterium]|nr:S8 family serine peptidase [Gemmatimonadaceae bacterium]
MTNRMRLTCLAALVAITACERPTTPTQSTSATLSVGGNSRAADKVGPGVWAAIDRGEDPSIVVSLVAAESNDLAVVRRNVAAAQDDALLGVTDADLLVRRRFVAVPAFSAVARNRGAVMRLASNASVARVDLDDGGSGELTNAVAVIRANLRHAAGNRGTGVVVGVMDTGIDTDHPDLADAVVGQACFGALPGGGTAGFCANATNRQLGAGAAEDNAGHGTHVSGIVASNGTVSGAGVAPDVGIFAFKVMDNCSFSGCFYFASELVAAFDYVLANPQLNIRILNLSLGTGLRYAGNCDNANALTMAGASAVNALRTAGVITFSSSGNNGSTTMGFPACLANVVSVGATSNADVLTGFSNINATTDILAPGLGIVSDAIGGGTFTASGTSMASPMAAGCAALLIQSGNAVTPAAIEARLKTSSVQLTRGTVTLPRIDCGPDAPPPNTAPTITVAQASVAVAEGATGSNSGTFADVNGDQVTVTASVGTITPATGTWSWSYATSDGPAQSQTVTVTANDGRGGVTSTTFALAVTNVAPSV